LGVLFGKLAEFGFLGVKVVLITQADGTRMVAGVEIDRFIFAQAAVAEARQSKQAAKRAEAIRVGGR
jgi:hypothetical protein